MHRCMAFSLFTFPFLLFDLPLIRKIQDLSLKLRLILIGHALTSGSHIHKPSGSGKQTFCRRVSLLLYRLLGLNRNPDALGKDLIRDQVRFSARERRKCRKTELFLHGLGKFLCHRILAVNDKYPLQRFFEAFQPLQQPVQVRMSADSLQAFDPCPDFDGLAEKLDLLLTLQDPASQRASRLIADEQDRTLDRKSVV